MKTPMQELIETFEQMRSPIDSSVDVAFAISLMKSMLEKEEKVMCDLYGRPLNLSDVPMTIMTRKEALIKQGGDENSINKLYKETMNVKEK